MKPSTSFPGATAVSRVSVYDWLGRDGARGGTPHLHTASTEAYVVLSGTGRLETLDSSGFLSTPLRPGVVVWFTPGTIHRAINDSGDLTVLVIMQNAGLPENGDAVMTFPPEHLVNAVAYGRAAGLPHADPDRREPAAEEAGRRRFELALEGYLRLKETTLRHGPSALDDFHAAAASLVAAKATAWERLVEGGAVMQAQATKRHLESLGESESFFLSAAETTIGSRASSRNYGMCGRIETWNVSEAEPDRGESSR